MHSQIRLWSLFVAFLIISSAPGTLKADECRTSIQVPGQTASGAARTVTATFSHHGNNFLHYVAWAYIRVNGQAAGGWDFSWRSRPEAAVFVRTVTVPAAGPVAVEAECSCNIHGSSGPARTVLDSAP